MDNNNRISSPIGVSALMRELWERHKCGKKAAANNIYFVDRPGPTPEEENQMRLNRDKRPNPDADIDMESVKKAVEKLRGW